MSAMENDRAVPATLSSSRMDESDFEGTLVLEQLAAIGKVEEFFDAIDSDDVVHGRDFRDRARRPPT